MMLTQDKDGTLVAFESVAKIRCYALESLKRF